MTNFHKCSVLSLTTTTTRTLHLPNELLLDILLHVAHHHPYSLPTLYRINRHWFHLIKRYEPLLWKTATLATFPVVTLQDPEDENSQSQQDPAARWRRVYGIHLGWLTRKAQVLLVKPQRPEPRSAQSASLVARMMTQQEQQQQQQQHGHVHDHHQLALLEYYGQHASVVSEDDRHHGNAISSASSSSSLSLLSHEPPMVIHSSASTRPCMLMDESIVSHGAYTNSNNNENSVSRHGGNMDGSHSWSVVPQQQQQQQQEQEDTLSCSFCTYADLCLIPQLRICVRVHRNRNQPLMQVLDWSLQHGVEMDGGVDNSHQDLISGTAVNERGTMMASCSIDGTVRVWDLNQAFRVGGGGGGDHHDLRQQHHQGSTTGGSFLDKVERFGCPIKSRWLLTGHVGWVNAVAMEETTVVSGGSDHTVRVWDALTGTLKHLIPDLYTSRPELGLGVYAVAIHGSSVIGSGSVMEGYQLHDLRTGELIFELDEPLSSRDHVRFENELYQQYASRIAITDTVVVTNSKMEGMLCVWSRQTGELMYRIHVSAAAAAATTATATATAAVPAEDAGLSRAWKRRQQQEGGLVTYEANGSSARTRREGVAAGATGAAMGIHGDEETVHTFKINKAGSMLMCTLCDGRATLIEFGSGSASRKIPCNKWVVEATGHGSLTAPAESQNVGYQQHQEHQEHYHHCGTLAWAWTRTRQGHNRVVLV